jgi:hypothetical protein
MARQIIESNLAPITWSTVDDAFKLINDNFSELYGSIGLILSLDNLPSSLIPSQTNSYDLGSPIVRWKDLYLSGSGIFFQNAAIIANLSGSVELPIGSTVDGNPILTNVNSFSSIQIIGSDTLEAGGSSDTLTLIPGSNISIISDVVSNTVTISSTFEGSLSGLSDTTFSDLVSGQVLKFNGTAWINEDDTSVADTGNITFNESTVNTSNLSDITFTPNVIFQSNITLEGDIITTGSGTPELFSDNDIVLTASERVIINTSPIKMASFTTVERDELIAQSGDVIYNTTDNKFQGYANNVWVDLH